MLAAKEETTPVFPLAAGALASLNENPHRGSRLPTAVLYQSQALANSNTASGLRVCFYDFGRRSRSTGKLRDNETGLDFFGARYFSGAQGRFTTPDWSAQPTPVPYADFRYPQTLNLYAYMQNNPLKDADADGHGPLTDWLVQKVAAFVTTHPAVAEALEKVTGSAGGKVSAGVGGGVNVGPVKLSGNASVYVGATTQGAVNEGIQATGEAKVGTLGVDVNGNLPVLKNSQLVNPLSAATGNVSPAVVGEHGENASAVLSMNSTDTSVGGFYGEGFQVGAELSTETSALGDLVGSVLGAITSDLSGAWNSLTTLTQNPSAQNSTQEQSPQNTVCGPVETCR